MASTLPAKKKSVRFSNGNEEDLLPDAKTFAVAHYNDATVYDSPTDQKVVSAVASHDFVCFSDSRSQQIFLPSVINKSDGTIDKINEENTRAPSLNLSEQSSVDNTEYSNTLRPTTNQTPSQVVSCEFPCVSLPADNCSMAETECLRSAQNSSAADGRTNGIDENGGSFSPSAVDEQNKQEPSVKIRYVHMNDRVYAVGGLRSDNRLQWYAVRGANSGSGSKDVVNQPDTTVSTLHDGNADQVSIYQFGGEQSRQQQENYGHDDDHPVVRSDEVISADFGRWVDSESLDETDRSPGSNETYTRSNCRPFSAAAGRESQHNRSFQRDFDADVNQGRSNPQTMTLTTMVFPDEVQQLKDIYDSQLKAFSKQVDNLNEEINRNVLQLYESRVALVETESRLSQQIDKNRESAEEITRLREMLASRDLELTSAQAKLDSLNQTVNELQTKNINLMRRAELLMANGQAPQVMECLRPCCLASTGVQMDSSNLADEKSGYASRYRLHSRDAAVAAVGPVLKRRTVRYQTETASVPVRCRSAPVGSTAVHSEHVQMIPLNNRELGNRKDYFEELFEDVNNANMQFTPAGHENICQKLTLYVPADATIEHSYNICTASTTCDVRILEVSKDGKYIRIINTSPTQEYEIGSHILQQNIRGHSVSVFRFPQRVTLPIMGAVTVWSESGKQPKSLSHYLALEFVFKGLKKWAVGPECTTVLCRPNGQAVAWYTAARHVKDDVFGECRADDGQSPSVIPAITGSSTDDRRCSSRISTANESVRPAGDTPNNEKWVNHTVNPANRLLEQPIRPDSRDSFSNNNNNNNFSTHARASSASIRFNGDYIPGLPFAGAPAQRLGSASLRRYVAARPPSATVHQTA